MKQKKESRMRYHSYCIILILLIWPSYVDSLLVGSNTAVSRNATTSSFPAGQNNNNEIRGFVAMEAGFTLGTAAAITRFNAYFPVGSTVTLNGGIIRMFRDLAFDSNATIANGGLIDAFSRTVTLPNRNGTLTLPNGLIFNNANVICNSDLSLNGPLRFNGNSILNGQYQTLNLGALGSLVTGTGASLLLRDITIRNVRAGNFFCVDNAGTVSFDNVTLILDSNYSFTQGRFDVITSALVTGTNVFAYQSSAASSIRANATLLFDSGMTFSYIPPIASGNLLVLTDTSSNLHLYETTLYSTPTGLRLTKGNLIIEGRCPIRSDARVLAEAIMFGDGVSAANDLTVDVLPESGLDVISGFLLYNNVAG